MQYNGRVNSLIHALTSLGLKKDDRISLLSWNRLECTDVTGAAMKGGFIVSSFNPRMRVDELDYIINDSEVCVLFVGPELEETANQIRSRLPRVFHYISLEGKVHNMIGYQELLASFSQEEPLAAVDESDPFILFYTSGTTGVPRGAICRSYRKLEEARTKVFTIGIQPEHRHIMILPLFHDNLARYKAPRSMDFIESLPQNPPGKVLKQELRAKYRETK